MEQQTIQQHCNVFDEVFAGSDLTPTASSFGFIPDGVYKLTKPLMVTIKQFSGARVEGASMGNTILLQTANGVPIIQLSTTTYSHSFEIGHLQLKYVTPQTTLGQYAAIYMSDGKPAGYFNQHFHHLTFINCSRGIACNPNDTVLVWGTSIDH